MKYKLQDERLPQKFSGTFTPPQHLPGLLTLFENTFFLNNSTAF